MKCLSAAAAQVSRALSLDNRVFLVRARSLDMLDTQTTKKKNSLCADYWVSADIHWLYSSPSSLYHIMRGFCKQQKVCNFKEWFLPKLLFLFWVDPSTAIVEPSVPGLAIDTRSLQTPKRGQFTALQTLLDPDCAPPGVENAPVPVWLNSASFYR